MFTSISLASCAQRFCLSALTVAEFGDGSMADDAFCRWSELLFPDLRWDANGAKRNMMQ